MSAYVPPTKHRSLRACLVCSIVQESSVFQTRGCPNCEPFLNISRSTDNYHYCTSQVFEGLIALTDQSQSWSAKWLRLEGYVRGVYALKVEGNLPDDNLADLERAGVKYIPRDGSLATEEA